MTTVSPGLLDAGPVVFHGRPRYEGSNIRTWIGFKNFMYLVEEGILHYFRERGVGANMLYRRHGLGLEIVDCSAQLPTALEIDDEVTITIEPSPRQKPGNGAAFVVTITVPRNGEIATACKAKVRVGLIQERSAAPDIEPVPAVVEPYTLTAVEALVGRKPRDLTIADGQELAEVLTPKGSGSFLWTWKIPYYKCHYSERVQHSAYVRAMEEVVDHFLRDRNLEIGTLLRERDWIPVVSRCRVELLADAVMEEYVHTVFTVEDILRDSLYTARMDCYVRRGNQLVHTATGSIMHGYSNGSGPRAGYLTEFDKATIDALLGDRA
jgi:acyl-CoA thioesterase FadM